MNNPQNIINAIRAELRKFQSELHEKLACLSKEGLLTERDKAKIEVDMQMTYDGLSRALNDELHSEQPFREEWVRRVVGSYQDRITEQVKEIENRRYTDDRVEARIKRVKEAVLSEATGLPTNRKVDVEVGLKKLEKQLWEDIRGISRKHSRRAQLIETWLQEFEVSAQALLRPRIGS